MVARDPGLRVVVADLSDEDFEVLREEKKRNARGTLSGNPSDSVAAVGRRLAEEALRREIRMRHLGIRESSNPGSENVTWDFLGSVRDRQEAYRA